MNEFSDGQPLRPDVVRAEEILDQMGQTVSRVTADVSLRILKGIALAREEAEDIVAEAQSLRHREQG